MENPILHPALLHLLILALRLEGDGQYSLAKLARAAADSLCRRTAYQDSLSTEKQDLVDEIAKVVDELSGLEMDAGLLAAFRRGGASISNGRLPLITDIPHPYVCRICRHITLGAAPEKCPACGAWPDTFQRFTPIYWLDALDPPAALKALRRMPAEVMVMLDGLTEQEMIIQPPDGGWAIRNIISHLRDAQDVLNFRLELFAKDAYPVLESKAIFIWATDEAERPPSTLEIFEHYQATRAKIIARLEDLPDAEWRRTGWHEEFGEVSINQQVSYFASHEPTHLPQIERLRKLAIAMEVSSRGDQ